MKYTPKEISENVNVSKTSPLADFFTLSMAVIALLVIVFFSLGLVVGYVANRMPEKYETVLGDVINERYVKQFGVELPDDPRRDKLQRIVDRLSEHLPEHSNRYRVRLVKNKLINALALPGGDIIVLTGLLDKADSENEIALVLGHELGHFQARDHLKSLGRGLVLYVLTSLVAGADSSSSEFVAATLLSIQAQYSQDQELEADITGLELLDAVYGHVGGATDFFRRIKNEESRSDRLQAFFSSHPLTDQRIEQLEKLIFEKGYRTGPLTPK